MASRLLLHKFSGMSRSTGLLGAHVSGARAAAATPEGVFHGTAAVHPGMTAHSNSLIGYAARYFSVFPCSHADSKTSLTATGLSSTIMNNMKPAFLDFARGLNRTFSSSASKSNSHKFTMEPEIAARQAQYAARKPKESVSELIRKDVNTTIALMAFSCFNILYMLSAENNGSISAENNGSRCCSDCCKCHCHSNPKVQQD